MAAPRGEWEERLAKEDKGVILSYINNTTITFKLATDSLVEAKYDNPPVSKAKKKSKFTLLEPGENLRFGVKMKKKDKEVKLSHTWLQESGEDCEFIFSLLLPVGSKGKAAHQLKPETLFAVKKTANWKVKPPIVTVTMGDPNAVIPPPEAGPQPTPAPVKKEKSTKKKKEDEGSSEEKKVKAEESKPVKSDSGSTPKKLPKPRKDVKGSNSGAVVASSAPATPVGTPIQSNPQIQMLKEQVGQQVQLGMACVDAGQFSNALQCFVQSVGFLVNSAGPEAYQIFPEEIIFAIRYAQASQFLLEMQRLQFEKLYKQLALLSRFTADLAVQPHHRLTNIRIAINLNFQVGNFFTVGRFITLLKETGVQFPEQPLYDEMFKTCEENTYQEHSVPVGMTNPQAINFCFQTLRVIHGNTNDFCPFCKSTFQLKLLTNCIYCNTALQTITNPVS